MNNKSLIEQQDLVRYPRIMGEDYSDLHCTICYKRIGEDAWMLNAETLPEKFRVIISESISNRATINSSFVFTPEEFLAWFSDIQSFYGSDRDIGDCEGNTLLEKIKSWFKYLKIEMEYASCN